MTDSKLLSLMINELDGACVANDGDDVTVNGYYYNGGYTDYGMDVKTLENPFCGCK